MPEKKEDKKINQNKEEKPKREIECHPVVGAKRTFGQRASDNISKWGGSWIFISIFLLLIIFWISLNAYILLNYGKKTI